MKTQNKPLEIPATPEVPEVSPGREIPQPIPPAENPGSVPPDKPENIPPEI